VGPRADMNTDAREEKILSSLPEIEPRSSVRVKVDSCDGVRLPFQHCGLDPVLLSPDVSEYEPVSRRDRLGLTPNFTARALWPSAETSRGVGRWAKEKRI
jgi:hypothetical protein